MLVQPLAAAAMLVAAASALQVTISAPGGAFYACGTASISWSEAVPPVQLTYYAAADGDPLSAAPQNLVPNNGQESYTWIWGGITVPWGYQVVVQAQDSSGSIARTEPFIIERSPSIRCSPDSLFGTTISTTNTWTSSAPSPTSLSASPLSSPSQDTNTPDTSTDSISGGATPPPTASPSSAANGSSDANPSATPTTSGGGSQSNDSSSPQASPSSTTTTSDGGAIAGTVAPPAGKKSNAGAIAGGVVGGVLGLALLLLLAWCVWRRRRKDQQAAAAWKTGGKRAPSPGDRDGALEKGIGLRPVLLAPSASATSSPTLQGGRSPNPPSTPKTGVYDHVGGYGAAAAGAGAGAGASTAASAAIGLGFPSPPPRAGSGSAHSSPSQRGSATLPSAVSPGSAPVTTAGPGPAPSAGGGGGPWGAQVALARASDESDSAFEPASPKLSGPRPPPRRRQQASISGHSAFMDL